MTQGHAARTAQKAIILEEAKIDFSVYNLANFTKHVFTKTKQKVSKIKKAYCTANPGCQKATLLEEAKIKFSVYNLRNFYNLFTAQVPCCL